MGVTITDEMPVQTLGERMKSYEHAYRRRLPTRTYTLLRLDGHNFGSYTRRLDKPFDAQFAADMAATMKALCENATGVAFAYTQSDEISLLLTDFATPTTQAWHGGVEAKILSLSAAKATSTFNRLRPDQDAEFDSRVWTLDSATEVANYFLWRQRDATKNSISMAASTHFSHQRLMGMNSNERIDLLWDEKGIDWSDYPAWARQGQVAYRVPQEETVTYVDRRTDTTNTKDIVRNVWQATASPDFDTPDNDGWLSQMVPSHPDEVES
jgi:tRNA(His) guanylyltransferase